MSAGSRSTHPRRAPGGCATCSTTWGCDEAGEGGDRPRLPDPARWRGAGGPDPSQGLPRGPDLHHPLRPFRYLPRVRRRRGHHVAAQPDRPAPSRPSASASAPGTRVVPAARGRGRDDRVEQRLGTRFRHPGEIGRLLLLACAVALRHRPLPRTPGVHVTARAGPAGHAARAGPVGQAGGRTSGPLPRHLRGRPRAHPGDLRSRGGRGAGPAQLGPERRAGADLRPR